MKEITISAPVKYAVERSLFEINRTSNNIAFLLGSHINDEDDSYLKQDVFQKTEESCIEKHIINNLKVEMILNELIGFIPKYYYFDTQNYKLIYSESCL